MIKLIHGNDSYRSNEYIKKSLINAHTSYKVIDCENHSVDSIIETISTNDIFNPISQYIIKNLSTYKNSIDVLEYIHKHVEENKDYFFFEQSKLPKTTKYYKYIEKCGEIVEFESLKKVDFKKYVKEKLEKCEIKYEIDAFNIFIEYLDNNTELTNNEIEKIILSGTKTLTSEHVKNNIVDTRSVKIWELLDNINLMEKEKAIVLAKEIIDGGEDINYIISMLDRNLRLISQYYSLKSKFNNISEIAKELSTAPFIIKTIAYYANRVSYEKLKKLYNSLVQMDIEVKSSNLNDLSLLNLFIIKTIDNN